MRGGGGNQTSNWNEVKRKFSIQVSQIVSSNNNKKQNNPEIVSAILRDEYAGVFGTVDADSEYRLATTLWNRDLADFTLADIGVSEARFLWNGVAKIADWSDAPYLAGGLTVAGIAAGFFCSPAVLAYLVYGGAAIGLVTGTAVSGYAIYERHIAKNDGNQAWEVAKAAQDFGFGFATMELSVIGAALAYAKGGSLPKFVKTSDGIEPVSPPQLETPSVPKQLPAPQDSAEPIVVSALVREAPSEETLFREVIAAIQRASRPGDLEDDPAIVAFMNHVFGGNDHLGKIDLLTGYEEALVRKFGKEIGTRCYRSTWFSRAQLADIGAVLDDVVADVDRVSVPREFVFGSPFNRWLLMIRTAASRGILSQEQMDQGYFRIGMAIKQRFGEAEAKQFFSSARSMLFSSRIPVKKSIEIAVLNNVDFELMPRAVDATDIEVLLCQFREAVEAAVSPQALDNHPLWTAIRRYTAGLLPKRDRAEIVSIEERILDVLGARFPEEIVDKIYAKHLVPNVTVKLLGQMVDGLIADIHKASSPRIIQDSPRIQEFYEAIGSLIAREEVEGVQVAQWVVKIGVALREKFGVEAARGYCQGMKKFLSTQEVVLDENDEAMVLGTAHTVSGNWN